MGQNRIVTPNNLHQKKELVAIQIRMALTDKGFTPGEYKSPFQYFTSSAHAAVITVKLNQKDGICIIECDKCKPQYYSGETFSNVPKAITSL